LQAAEAGGAAWIVLCDTNGGSMPWDVYDAVSKVVSNVDAPIGIHTHNDTEQAVSNALFAVRAGARQIQGTIGGLGERCGNANLISMLANLELKMNCSAIQEGQLTSLTDLTQYVFELANRPRAKHMAFVGQSAFAHKGGMHVSGVRRNPETYEHMEPTLVGNNRRILVSDLAGKATIMEKIEAYGISIEENDPRVGEVVEKLKLMESRGYLYEGAEASFELLVKRAFSLLEPAYQLDWYRCSDERRGDELITEASVAVRVGDRQEHTASTGNGPVNALDNALRKALSGFYPQLNRLRLLDYKVRVLSAGVGTEVPVRVLVESGNGERQWGTVGVGTNVIDASYEALRDAVEYCLRCVDQVPIAQVSRA